MTLRQVVCILLIGLLAHAQASEAVCECRCKGTGQTFIELTADCMDDCLVCQPGCPGDDYLYKCREQLDPYELTMVLLFQIALAVVWAAYIQYRRRRLALPTDPGRSLLQCVACYCFPCWTCCYLYMESQELNARARYQQQLPQHQAGVAIAIPVGPDGQPLPAGQYYAVQQPGAYANPNLNPNAPYVATAVPVSYGQQQQQQPVYAAVAMPLPAAAGQQQHQGTYAAVPMQPQPQPQAQPQQGQNYAGVYPGLAVQPSYAAMPAPAPSVFAGQPHRI